MTVAWDTISDDIEDRLGSLGQRAKKRTGIALTPNTFKVFGDSKLGDSYDAYDVVLKGHIYSCSCQKHTGGEFRKFCSHIAYIVMARRGVVPWSAEEPVTAEDSPHQPVFQYLPDDTYMPSFINQGQEPTAQMRADMDAHFGDAPPLPQWVKLIRPHQWLAYCDVLFHLDAGKKAVFVSAPTGSGKTLIGEMVRRSFAKPILYTCTTKTLQDQIEDDFSYAAVIKGRSNYPTLNHPGQKWLACDLCDKVLKDDPCTYCWDTGSCPYVVARDQAVNSPFTVANVAYLLAEGNTPRSRFAGRSLVVVDEADALEDELMRYIEIALSPTLMKQLGIKPPEKKTVTESWQAWVVDTAIPALTVKIDSLKYSSDAKVIRTHKRLVRLKDQLREVEFNDDWVYTGYEQGWVTFKPVKVTAEAPEYLWPLANQWILMSATIISAQQMAEDLGLEDDEWAVVEVESTFPVENRPIYVEPVANMTAKTKETEWPKLLKRLSQIADHHNERILVHTVSYKLAEYLANGLGSRSLTYRNAKERESVLVKFRSSENAILLAPSFERGIDLPYDQCRVVVVAKVPFPNLGDKQVSKRLYSRGGKGWYSMQTIRSLVQMTGRAMRHEDDQCEIYILDAQFLSNIWKKSRHIIPSWWSDAIYGSPRMSPSPNFHETRGGRM